MIFIAHDLRCALLLRSPGRDVPGADREIGPAEAIYLPPYHPLHRALLAVPIPDPRAEQKHIRLSGTVPSALNPPSGCRFHTRCPRRNLLPDGGAICEQQSPPAQFDTEQHRIYCHIPLDALRQMEAVVTIEKGGRHAG